MKIKVFFVAENYLLKLFYNVYLEITMSKIRNVRTFHENSMILPHLH